MAEQSITLNGQTYRIACEDGQEARLAEIARYADGRLADVVQQVGQIGDSKLLAMLSLILADELLNARPASGTPLSAAEWEHFYINQINELAEKLEKLAREVTGA